MQCLTVGKTIANADRTIAIGVAEHAYAYAYTDSGRAFRAHGLLEPRKLFG